MWLPMSFSVWQEPRTIVQNGSLDRYATADMIPSVGKQRGVVSRHDHIGGEGNKHGPQHKSNGSRCSLSRCPRGDTQTGRWTAGSRGQNYTFTYSISRFTVSHTNPFPFFEAMLHADIKATDHILITEYWRYFSMASYCLVWLILDTGIPPLPTASLRVIWQTGTEWCNIKKTMSYFKGTSVHFLCLPSRKNLPKKKLCGACFFRCDEMTPRWSKGEGGLENKHTHPLMDANHACPWLMCRFHSNTGSLSSSLCQCRSPLNSHQRFTAAHDKGQPLHPLKLSVSSPSQ